MRNGLRMLYYLKIGWIDWIETDHAPHTEEEKYRRTSTEEHMSGIQQLLFYGALLDRLRKEHMPEVQIDNLTCNNIRKTFPMVVESPGVAPIKYRTYDIKAFPA